MSVVLSGQRVSAARRAKKLSQAKLGMLVGASRATIARIEAGESVTLQWSWVLGMTKALRVSVLYLAGEREDPTPPTYLTAMEFALVDVYRKLDKHGQEAALSTLLEAQHAMYKERLG